MQTFKIEKTETQCVVTWRHYTHGVFVVFFVLAVLTVPMVIFTLQIPHALVAFFVALPLWIMWFILFTSTIHTLFGQTQFVLDEEGLNTIYTCLKFKSEKRFALAEIRRFEKEAHRSKNRDSHSLRVVHQEDNDNTMKSFRLHTNGGESKSFVLPVKDGIENELDTLCDQLNIFLGTLKAEVARIPAQWDVPEPIMFDFTSPLQHLEPPPKSRWYYQTDFDSIGFQKKGEDTIVDIIGLLFWAVFVNGIIAVFVLEVFSVLNPERQLVEVWWYGMLALSPFIAYGLFRIGVVLYYFLEWFRVTTWMFGRGAAEFRSVRFGSRRGSPITC